MEDIQKLIHFVARAFYEPKEVMVVDILILNDSVRDDHLASAMGLNIRDLQKVCGKLKVSGMIDSIARWEEIKPGEVVAYQNKDKKKLSRTYFYIDYPRTVNTIKYKLYKIGKILDQQISEQGTALPYKCSQCDQKFSTMDILMLPSTPDRIPLCDCCGSEVVADEHQNKQPDNEKYVKFQNETRTIIELLKKTDSLVMPQTDPRLPKLGSTNEAKPMAKQEAPIEKESVVVEIESVTESKEDEKLPDELQDYYDSLKVEEPVATIPMYLNLNRKRIAEEEEEESGDDEEFEEV